MVQRAGRKGLIHPQQLNKETVQPLQDKDEGNKLGILLLPLLSLL